MSITIISITNTKRSNTNTITITKKGKRERRTEIVATYVEPENNLDSLLTAAVGHRSAFVVWVWVSWCLPYHEPRTCKTENV